LLGTFANVAQAVLGEGERGTSESATSPRIAKQFEGVRRRG